MGPFIIYLRVVGLAGCIGISEDVQPTDQWRMINGRRSDEWEFWVLYDTLLTDWTAKLAKLYQFIKLVSLGVMPRGSAQKRMKKKHVEAFNLK